MNKPKITFCNDARNKEEQRQDQLKKQIKTGISSLISTLNGSAVKQALEAA